MLGFPEKFGGPFFIVLIINRLCIFIKIFKKKMKNNLKK